MRYTTEDIIKRFRKVHGDKYNYDKFVYCGMHVKSIITCRVHGDFEQEPHGHLKGYNCPKCAIDSRVSKISDTTEIFIEKARKVHGDYYDYSLVKYVNNTIPVEIICPVHGVFHQRPVDHLQHKGCKKCASETIGNKLRKTKEEFISQLKEIFGDRYDYSEINYVNTNTPVTLICPIHGRFEKLPYLLLNGDGCQKCSEEASLEKRKERHKNNFFEKARKIHGDTYDYSKVKYVSSDKEVEIICPIHGSFWQKPINHLDGCGCQQCAKEMVISSSEIELREYVSSITDNVIYNDRTVLENYHELDIYIPNKNLSIEFDGLYWHSTACKPNVNYHLNKTNQCNDKDIQLIHVFEDEWVYKKEIVKSNISDILNVYDYVVDSSSCTISPISIDDICSFVTDNSFDEYSECRYNYGLFNDDELVYTISVSDDFEIKNFCHKLYTNVIDGDKRMIDYILNEFHPNSLTISIDKRWNTGNRLKELGFVHVYDTFPKFYYVSGDCRLFENIGDKHRNIIYDCGNMVFSYLSHRSSKLSITNEATNKRKRKGKKEKGY